MTSDTGANATEYHYVLTVQVPAPQGYQVFTSTGVLTLTPGATRQEAYEFALRRMSEQANLPGPVATLFFSLEPNAVALAAPAGS